MKRKKEDYFVIALGVLLVVIIFTIAIISSSFRTKEQPPTLTPTPAPTATIPVNRQEDPEQVGPYININAEDQIKLLDRVNNRRKLSDEDMRVKAKVLTLLPSGERSGELYKSKDITIKYISTANLFQVEITTINIQQAKDEANVWFREQGFSQNAICEHPVMFYLNTEISSHLKELRIKFSPIGNGC